MKQGYLFDEPYFGNREVFRPISISNIDISSSLWYLLAQLNYRYV